MAKSPRQKPDRPRRQIPPATPPAAAGPPSLGIDQLIASSNLDLRTLVLLAIGEWSEMADLEWPPVSVRRWVEKADIRQTRGLLLTTLQRWHELRR